MNKTEFKNIHTNCQIIKTIKIKFKRADHSDYENYDH